MTNTGPVFVVIARRRTNGKRRVAWRANRMNRNGSRGFCFVLRRTCDGTTGKTRRGERVHKTDERVGRTAMRSVVRRRRRRRRSGVNNTAAAAGVTDFVLVSFYRSETAQCVRRPPKYRPAARCPQCRRGRRSEIIRPPFFSLAAAAAAAGYRRFPDTAPVAFRTSIFFFPL